MPRGMFYLAVTAALLLAAAYLGFKVWQLTGRLPGYDFRFIWVAGKVWAQGANPYDRSARARPFCAHFSVFRASNSG